LTDVNALILSALAVPELIAEMRELYLGYIATSPLETVFFVVS